MVMAKVCLVQGRFLPKQFVWYLLGHFDVVFIVSRAENRAAFPMFGDNWKACFLHHPLLTKLNQMLGGEHDISMPAKSAGKPRSDEVRALPFRDGAYLSEITRAELPVICRILNPNCVC